MSLAIVMHWNAAQSACRRPVSKTRSRPTAGAAPGRVRPPWQPLPAQSHRWTVAAQAGGPFLEMTGLPPDRQGHQMTAAERERLTRLTKSLRFNIRGRCHLLGHCDCRRGFAGRDRPEDHVLTPREGSVLLRGGNGFGCRYRRLQPAGGVLHGWVAGEEAARGALRRHDAVGAATAEFGSLSRS